MIVAGQDLAGVDACKYVYILALVTPTPVGFMTFILDSEELCKF